MTLINCTKLRVRLLYFVRLPRVWAWDDHFLERDETVAEH